MLSDQPSDDSAQGTPVDRALRLSEARYRTLVEKIPIGIYELDRDGRLLSINPAAIHTFGVRSSAQVIGRRLLDLLPESDRPYFATLLARAYAGETLDVEYTVVIKGRRHVFTATTVTIAEQDPAGSKLIVMAQDITDRVEARLNAEIERDRLGAVLESSNDAIVMFDLDDRLALVNRAWSQLFGLAETDVLDLSREAIFARIEALFAQPDHFLATLRSLFANPRNAGAGEVEIRRPEYHALVWYSVPVRTHARTSLGRLIIFRDTTREKQADQMKTEFVAVVSHELRTPLTSIKGFTELILDGDAGEIAPTVREFLEVVKTNANQLVAITDDILESSRIEARRITINPQAVAIAEVVKIVADLIQPLLAKKLQTLTLDLPAALPLVYADRDRLIQILTNLLGNAHKYTPSGGRIHIYAPGADSKGWASTPQATTGRSWLVVAVADNGIGIAPQEQELVFTRFYRISNAETQGIGGSGLGLHITRALVELHGGKIWLESERGRGTTFFFSLPTVDQQREPAVSSTADAAVMVIEPDDAIATLIQHHLERTGHTVIVARSEREALALAHSRPLILITMANRPPDIDGFALIERLRDEPGAADIPVIVIGAEENAERARSLGVAGHIAMPIDERCLIDIAAAALAQRRRNIALIVDDDPHVTSQLTALLARLGFNAIVAADGEQGLILATKIDPRVVLVDLWMHPVNGFQFLNALKQNPSTHAIPVIALTDRESPPELIARILRLGAANILTKPLDLAALEQLIRAAEYYY